MDKPVDVDHLRHHLQLYHAGYHQFVSHFPEGMAYSPKVLTGSIALIVPSGTPLSEGRAKLYSEWRKIDVAYTPGAKIYPGHNRGVYVHILILKAGDVM